MACGEVTQYGVCKYFATCTAVSQTTLIPETHY